MPVHRLLAGSGAPPHPACRQGVRRALGHGATAAAVAGSTLAVAAPVASVLAPAPVEVAVGLTAGDTRIPALPERIDGAVLAASVLPVRYAEPPGLGAAESLRKSAGLGDAARRAEEERLAREARVSCDADLSDLGAVKPHVRTAARFLSCLYDEPELIGIAGRGRVSDHPAGRALDLMSTGAKGDRIAACALANRAALGIDYVIWEQRINYGSGWERMENRGSVTENHFDHVHISFRPGAGGGEPDPNLCS